MNKYKDGGNPRGQIIPGRIYVCGSDEGIFVWYHKRNGDYWVVVVNTGYFTSQGFHAGRSSNKLGEGFNTMAFEIFEGSLDEVVKSLSCSIRELRRFRKRHSVR